MKKILFLGLLFITIASLCYAETTSSLDLLNNAKQYDGKPVTYRGEVIGDIMVRNDHAWLHVYDGSAAIAVWAEKSLVRNIRFSGDYGHKGDMVEVAGIFHRSCLEHGGDLDIHVEKIRIISPGKIVVEPMSRGKLFAGIFLFLTTLVFYVLKKISKRA